MLLLCGSSSLSLSKRSVLLKQIQAKCPFVESLEAPWLHLIQSRDAELLDPQSPSRKALDLLLSYGNGSISPPTVQAGKNVLFVLPRPGSITPWSTKATDIARICNLGDRIERLERGIVYKIATKDEYLLTQADVDSFSHLIHDRMTQVVQFLLPNEDIIFAHHSPKPLRTIDLHSSPSAEQSLSKANKELGLALAPDEISYLLEAYVSGAEPINRDPSDAELFMFAQVNSEHCRHKIFNASWTIDGTPKERSLFQMIRNTEQLNGTGTISAYSDNAAVIKGHPAPRFSVKDGTLYGAQLEDMPILTKVETHNHPTAVSPYPGAATGSGGEIRDEGAVGRGSKPKAGLSGFTVSNLLIPGFEQPWETDFGKPSHIASAFDIMIEGPLGASAFNNEFGRPALTGYFRTFSERIPLSGERTEVRGYHKPIMIAGGYGNVRPQFALKTSISPGAKIIVLGGPGLLIGLGGGAASSQASGASSAELDFASVQRDNAEMQRRCQQVIDACVSLEENPIQSIHDVGAGGLSNALPELVHDSGLGARFEIRDVLVADSSMSPMEIWCNESQERYVLAIGSDKADIFEQIARRERAPYSIVGEATAEEELIVTDRLLSRDVIRLKMSTLFGKPPRMSRKDVKPQVTRNAFDATLAKYLPSASPADRISEAVNRVLRLPSVGSKSFLVTIGDRSITGLVTREQMVGRWQVPVADVAVTRSSYGFDVISGEAMAMGERTPLALLSPQASARMAIAESLTNLAAAHTGDISSIKLSANWMCAASKEGEGANLYAAVEAVGIELCPALGIGIPVGKDSMSMSMKWSDRDEQREVTSPLSLIVTAFSPVEDVRATWTPELRTDLDEPTVLILIDLAAGKARLGGSALAQVFKEIGDEAPDVEDPVLLKAFYQGCQKIREVAPDLVLAYHDRSDGGLLTTVAEMCFSSRIGVEISLDEYSPSTDPLPLLFNEELGAVVQIRESQLPLLRDIFESTGFPSKSIFIIGTLRKPSDPEAFLVRQANEVVYNGERGSMQKAWAETSYKMQALRDNPETSAEEYSLIDSSSHHGLFYDLTFSVSPSRDLFRRPKVAILREQGVNGQLEMAWAFTAAGFDAIDVHMSDILSGRTSLQDFRGLAACGGFSYGDVLGAGKGWAHSVLLNQAARSQFTTFFGRDDTFALGVCNGCQFFSHLKGIISGAEFWPEFLPNRSERFEARTLMVEIVDNAVTRSSVFFRDMAGSKLPVAVAHGEGRVSFENDDHRSGFETTASVAVRYVDSSGKPTEHYPLNPNGSPGGVTGIQTPDGRILALMPHPERVVTLESNSWYTQGQQLTWSGVGPWFKLFQNARVWCN
ncbi:phosphoribosylformylglycinamidine synthase [Pleurotus ostreatus]|nr:phosphoribosylformylglycinamidine synthase [Pleurotus ostreatus]